MCVCGCGGCGEASKSGTSRANEIIALAYMRKGMTLFAVKRRVRTAEMMTTKSRTIDIAYTDRNPTLNMSSFSSATVWHVASLRIKLYTATATTNNGTSTTNEQHAGRHISSAPRCHRFPNTRSADMLPVGSSRSEQEMCETRR